MKKLLVALAAAAAALTLGVARASADGVTFGVNDNAGLYGNTNFWGLVKSENMGLDTIILRWNESTTDGFDGVDGAFLPKAMAAAQAAGVQVEFAVSPRHSAELSDQGGPAKFAAWLTSLAKTYPQVRQYVVMNECNQPLFVNPQYQNGQNISAGECGTWLAAGYDALKAVDPAIFVWGVGLSPRGNPPTLASATSTDPIDWLGFLGRWYKSSGRTKPLMDGLDLHPYPIPQGLPFATGYSDPSSYSVANLARVYSAFYGAFNGTSQKTVGPGGLPVQLNEVGIQTAIGSHTGYTGTEVSGTQAGGVLAPNDSESFQAQWYTQLVDYAECDADIVNVNVFKLIDETALEGWQSGLFYADGTPKASAAAVQGEIAKDAGKCPSGAAKRWAPGLATMNGLGTGGTATSDVAGTGTTKTLLTSVLGSYRKLAKGTPTTTVVSGTTTGTASLGTASTQLTVTWSLASSAFRTRQPQAAAKAKPAVRTIKVKKGQKIVVRFSPKGLKDGSYRLALTVKAAKGGVHASISTMAFAVKSGTFA